MAGPYIDPNLLSNPNSDILQQQGEPYESEGTMQLSQMGSQDARIIEKILELGNRLLDQLEHDLKGEILNEDNIWEKKKKQVINDEGVDALLSLFRIPLNPINSLSVYDEETIIKKCRLQHLHIEFLIKLHYKEWGIDLRDRSFIIHNLAGLYQSILLMAKNGKYLNSLSNTFTTREISRIGGDQQQGGGAFSGLRRRFKSWGL